MTEIALPYSVVKDLWEEAVGADLSDEIVGFIATRQFRMRTDQIDEFVRMAMGPPHWGNALEISAVTGLNVVNIRQRMKRIRDEQRASRFDDH